ncbi:hypothetical protein [Aquimarina latercula]|uniref:hypothetical protein n=1 Tax=Aquimarina latercula TaxID=987 RepID=UPI00040EF56C|nr:hypothetical protein [Aquimarina latercula]
MNKILGNTPEKDTITTVLKIVSAVYLVMNTIRLGIDLHEKIIKKSKLNQHNINIAKKLN